MVTKRHQNRCNYNILTGNPLSKADFQWNPVKQHTNMHNNTTIENNTQLLIQQ